MVPLDTPNSGLRQDSTLNTEQEILAQSTSDRSSKPESKEKKGGTQKEPKPKDLTKDGKLTGAELKKKAKEEKAAKRAREKEEKQGQQLPGSGPSGIEKTNLASQAAKKGVQVPCRDMSAVPKNQQQKQSSSSTAYTQKALAFRAPEAFPLVALPEPIGEKKEVALFGHLYGKARRVSIAGAVMGVHPAVLALGLKMSNYVICGSNARCISTLRACKMVGTCGWGPIEAIANLGLGNPILHNSTTKLYSSTSHSPHKISDRLSRLLPTTLRIDRKCYSMAESRDFSSRPRHLRVSSQSRSLQRN